VYARLVDLGLRDPLVPGRDARGVVPVGHGLVGVTVRDFNRFREPNHEIGNGANLTLHHC